MDQAQQPRTPMRVTKKVAAVPGGNGKGKGKKPYFLAQKEGSAQGRYNYNTLSGGFTIEVGQTIYFDPVAMKFYENKV